jgi:protein-tyrosine phosphatase
MRSRFLLAGLLLGTLPGTTPLQGQAAAPALPQLGPGESLGKALGLSAAPNLRDLGGYKTADGRTVARGLLYRSDRLALNADDVRKLAALGLVQDYDLRTAAEVQAQPDQIPEGVTWVGLDVLADGSPPSMSKLSALRDPKTASDSLGGGKAEAIFTDIYRAVISLPSARKAYGDLFTALADRSHTPALFHCTTGKDRTGWASAALLTLLGVPQKTVMADYLRSNDYILPFYSATIDRWVQAGGDRAILEALYGVRRQYLEASFDEMRKTYGSIEKYFSEGLGIDAAGQQALKDIYLTR